MSDHTVSMRPLASPGATVARIPGVAWVLFALVALFGVASPGFATPANLNNILVQSTILLIIALPMTLMIMTEGLDLSIGAVLTLASILYGMTLLATGSFTLAVLVSLGTGLGFGLVNGWTTAVPGIPPFVVTLGTLGIAQGLCLIVTDGQSVVGLPREVQFAYSGSLLGIPVPILIAVAVYLAMHALLYHTRFGISVPALGGNREALRQAGVNDSLCLIGVYALGGLMAGVAAPLLTARMNAGHPTAAIGMEFDAIVAVAVGGTDFERGNGWLFGTLLGVIAIGILRNGLNLLAIPSSVQVACVGLLVILAMLVDAIRSTES